MNNNKFKYEFSGMAHLSTHPMTILITFSLNLWPTTRVSLPIFSSHLKPNWHRRQRRRWKEAGKIVAENQKKEAKTQNETVTSSRKKELFLRQPSHSVTKQYIKIPRYDSRYCYSRSSYLGPAEQRNKSPPPDDEVKATPPKTDS